MSGANGHVDMPEAGPEAGPEASIAPSLPVSGPMDIRDDGIREEVKKAAVWVGMVALVALAVLLVQPLLVIFGGIVFAGMIEGGQRLLGRVLPLPRLARIAVLLLLSVSFGVWVIMFAGSQIAQQALQLPTIIEAQGMRLLAWGNLHGINVQLSDANKVAGELLGGIGQLTSAVGGIVGGFTTALLIVILGIYFALEPDLYQRGLAWMLPGGSRDHWHGTTHRMGKVMRMLLFGRILGMVVEGFFTWLLLAAYGVPMAGLLGLLTGLLAFLPNIGAPISGVLMILVGFSGGANMGYYCIMVYVVVQTVDGNIIVPMVAKKTADLAPALVLGAQLIFGVLFGVLGLMLADPLVAMIKIALERQAEHNDRPETSA